MCDDVYVSTWLPIQCQNSLNAILMLFPFSMPRLVAASALAGMHVPRQTAALCAFQIMLSQRYLIQAWSFKLIAPAGMCC
jgi:hypothetical protein